jgi:hypothetical protein
MNLDAMQRFFRECRSDLMRIVRATRGELQEGDAQNTAYEIAAEIQLKRGRQFDFNDDADRSQLLKWMHARLVKFADKHLRFAVSLDEDPDEDRPTQATLIARGIKAHDCSDPAVLLEREQAEREAEEALLAHYSELVGYVLLFRRFDTRKGLAAFLRITAGTLRYRVRRAERRFAYASLFDGVERVDPEFQPTIRRGRRCADEVPPLSGEQREWAF